MDRRNSDLWGFVTDEDLLSFVDNSVVCAPVTEEDPLTQVSHLEEVAGGNSQEMTDSQVYANVQQWENEFITSPIDEMMVNNPQEQESVENVQTSVQLNQQPQLMDVDDGNCLEMTDSQVLSIIQQWGNDQSSEYNEFDPAFIDEMAECIGKYMENMPQEDQLNVLNELESYEETQTITQINHNDGHHQPQLEEVRRDPNVDWCPLLDRPTQVFEVAMQTADDIAIGEIFNDLLEKDSTYELMNIGEEERHQIQEFVSLQDPSADKDPQQHPINLNDEHLKLMRDIETFGQEQPVQVVDTHNIIEDWQAEAEEKERCRKERGKAPSKCFSIY